MAYRSLPFHVGEEKMHALTKVPMRDNATNPTLTARAAHQIGIYSLMALGTIDPKDDNRPWCSLWGGQPPIAQPIAQGGIIGMRTNVDASFDPVAKILLGQSDDGEVVKQNSQDKGSMVSALSIGLEQRGRVKLYGRMVAGALNAEDTKEPGSEDKSFGKAGVVQLVLKIEQSLGNCPKYLNKKAIVPHVPKPQLVSTDIKLCNEAIDLVHQADMFFISSAHEFEDMDTNHRGGPPGFARVQQPTTGSLEGSAIVWPEYSGNNLYQTLGNLMVTPRAGLCIPNFSTGDVLYVTGDTEVLINEAANQLIAKSKLAVRLAITGARFVKTGLGFRGEPIQDSSQGRSPYNPRVRYLRDERVEEFSQSYDGKLGSDTTAKLIKKTKLSPTITKYRFALSDPTAFGPWNAGQYVALDFSEEMDMGYSHMRDDDPTSLNDDFLRTFTVSSPPNSLGIHGEEFEVVMRKVGSVTNWLMWQREGSTEIGVKGFGGSFSLDVEEGEKAAFLAGGIGITPLLSQSKTIKGMMVRWSCGIKDVGVVLDVWEQCSEDVRKDMVVYLTGSEDELSRDEDKDAYQKVITSGLRVERRRWTREDLTALENEVSEWYLCAAPTMRKVIQQWLPNQSIIFENFDY